MAKKIRINSTTGPSDGADLDGYYFQEDETTGGYNFYAPNGGSPLNTNGLITPSNRTFQFSIPQPPPNPNNQTLNFTLTVSSFPAVVQMSGSWSDTVSVGIKDVPGSGTFQAQAGTTPMEKDAAAASAK